MDREEIIYELCNRFGYIEDYFQDWELADLEEELDMCIAFEEDEYEDF